jgi:hypothetical protein
MDIFQESTDYQLTSNVSRERNSNSGCVTRFIHHCNSSQLLETSGRRESEIIIARSRVGMVTSWSGFGLAHTKITTTSPRNCGSRLATPPSSHRSRQLTRGIRINFLRSCFPNLLSWVPEFLICNPGLAECFHRSDSTTHDTTDHAADRIPTTHSQTAEGATGDAEQDVTDWML